MMSNKKVILGLWVLLIASLVFAGGAFANRWVQGTALYQHNKTVQAQNKKVQAYNNTQKNSTFNKAAESFLYSSFNNSLSGASSSWDKVHANDAFITNLGDAMQGKNKNDYVQSYNNQNSSNVTDVQATQFGDSFTLTFDYNLTAPNINGGSTTKTLGYVVTGHRDGNHWVADKVEKNRA